MQDDIIFHNLKLIAKLPGVGEKTAKRFLLHLMGNPDLLLALSKSLEDLSLQIVECEICHQVGISNPCDICSDPKRSDKIICVVENLSSLWAIDSSGVLGYKYHVLGGLLSAIRGIRPQDLKIDALVERCKQNKVEEVILAISPTLEGQSTLHYIYDELLSLGVKITTPAQGIPIGGELDYFDESTLLKALEGRKLL